MNVIISFPTVSDLNEGIILLEDYHTKFCWGHATIEVIHITIDDKYIINLIQSYNAKFSVNNSGNY